MPEISVIVPVYNCERYLRKCIDSILAQNFKDFELIGIDDGSTDKSGAILDEYAARDKRVRVIHQPNGGLIAARIRGVEESRGSHITFVDADDMILPEMLAVMVKARDEYGADIVGVRSRTLSRNGLIRRRKAELQPEEYDLHDAVKSLFAYGNLGASMWGKLYKKELFDKAWEDLKLLPNIFYGEDTCINMLLFKYANRIIASNWQLYLYRVGGASSRGTQREIKGLATLYQLRKAKLRVLGFEDLNVLNFYQALYVALYYVHYSKSRISRSETINCLQPVIADIRQYCPNGILKNAFDPEFNMSEREFRNINRDSMIVLLKRFVLSVF